MENLLTTRPADTRQLHIGCFVFDQQDQIDFTGPFEVFSRIPNVTVHVMGKTGLPVRDVKGLLLTPDMTIAEAPELDVLHVSGGLGQQSLMDDEELMAFIQRQFYSGRYVFSVCTGALLCGAAGILRGKRATTHWAAWDLLPYYGAIPVKERVVVDKNLVSTAGVTAGIDGALEMAALLRSQAIAEQIQLEIEYAPEPRFTSGTPETASAEVIQAFYTQYAPHRLARKQAAQRYDQGQQALGRSM